MLNDQQQQAVTHPLGSLLILAGAGSGKTRVIVNRIAWLIESQSVNPSSIIAVTFTNKAAKEMQHRLSHTLSNVAGMWIGTFHSLAYRMLKIAKDQYGNNLDPQIIDSDDQIRIIKKIFIDANLDGSLLTPKDVQYYINRIKDEGGVLSNEKPYSYKDKLLKDLFVRYEHYLKSKNLIDFGGIILNCLNLLNHNDEFSNIITEKFKHFFVDEFQDTNKIQYEWLKKISSHAESVTVVGDDDQGIYGWRGARVENINNFLNEFDNCSLIKLEQNYRSSQNILKAANVLIGQNTNRIGKELWTDSVEGKLIDFYKAYNEYDEAEFIAKNIISSNYKLNETAVLYRSNAQSRVIEQAMQKYGIPYAIYGGLRFFDRAEIKDVLSYLRLIKNTQDDLSFKRIINLPPRGIGQKTLGSLFEFAKDQNLSYWDAAIKFVNLGLCRGKAASSFKEFINTIHNLTVSINNEPLHDYLINFLNKIDILTFYSKKKDETGLTKIENIKELVSTIIDFSYEHQEKDNSEIIKEFLSYTSLDSGDRKTDPNALQIMTIHSSKGLEFENVYLAGLEEGLFPHFLCSKDDDKLEEERRLCYVAITRAKRRLTISYASSRRVDKHYQYKIPSRFLKELPLDVINILS